MSSVLIVSLVVVAWGYLLARLLRPRLMPGVLRRIGDNPTRAGWIAAGGHLAALVGFVLAATLAISLQGDGHRTAAFWIAAPALLAYAPLIVTAAPHRFSGYRDLRPALEEDGASKDVARAIAWAGGPFALVGFVVIVATIVELS